MPKEKNIQRGCDPDWMIDNAKALRRAAKELEQHRSKTDQTDNLLFLGVLLAVPDLLLLATEIALKAWHCRERNVAAKPTHNLLKLFRSLNNDTQEFMEAKMRKLSHYSRYSEDPRMKHQSPEVQEMFGARMNPLRDVLSSHADLYTRWRYSHEGLCANFETSEIYHALTVLIDTYENKWPPFQLGLINPLSR